MNAPLRSCHLCGANTNSMLDRTYKPTCGMCYREMYNRGLLDPNQMLIPTELFVTHGVQTTVRDRESLRESNPNADRDQLRPGAEAAWRTAAPIRLYDLEADAP